MRTLPLVVLALVLLLATIAGVAALPRLDEVGDVDAVVVLGGGSGERLELGMSLAIDHSIPLVLSGGTVAEGAAVGLRCGGTLTVGDQTVPVHCVHPVPVATAGEARDVTTLADAQGWDRVAVATSTFHVNRARTLFVQCLGPDAVDVTGAPAPTNLVAEAYRYGRELVGRLAAVTVRRAC